MLIEHKTNVQTRKKLIFMAVYVGIRVIEDTTVLVEYDDPKYKLNQVLGKEFIAIDMYLVPMWIFMN